MRPDLNLATSSLPNEHDPQPRSTAVFPLHLPRLSQDLFPITSQADLVAKLTAAALSPRSLSASVEGTALPAGHAPPYDATGRRQR
jgi:hypothetical protein